MSALDAYLATIDRLERDIIPAASSAATLTSIAISLKRIADCMESDMQRAVAQADSIDIYRQFAEAEAKEAAAAVTVEQAAAIQRAAQGVRETEFPPFNITPKGLKK